MADEEGEAAPEMVDRPRQITVVPQMMAVTGQ
jgi:hypothetical protein